MTRMLGRDACSCAPAGAVHEAMVRAQAMASREVSGFCPRKPLSLKEAGLTRDFALLRAMLFYVDEFPERLHHHKEDELLFPRVRARCPLDEAIGA